MASPQATEAAARKRRERVAALGAVTLPEAAVVVGVGEDSLRRWVADGHSKTAFRGPKGTGGPWLFRLDELRAELAAWRCSWPDDCAHYALLSTSGLCKRHDAAVRRNGLMGATEFADKHRNGISAPALLARIKRNEIPAQRVARGGRPECWLVHEESTLALLDERFRCQWRDGCPRYALGPSRHCNKHAGAAEITNAAGKVTTSPCATCGNVYEHFPSQIATRARAPDGLCHACTLDDPKFSRKGRETVWNARREVVAEKEAEGLLTRQGIAAYYSLVPTPSLATSLARRGLRRKRVEVLGIPFNLFPKSDATRDRRAVWRRDGSIRAARTRAALKREQNRLEVARILKTLSPEQLAAREQQLEDRKKWALRVSPGAPAGAKATTVERNQR